MTKDQINKLRDMVEYALRYHPSTRNSDVTLTICIWRQFYPDKLINGKGYHSAVMLERLYDLPREDNIKRIRATYNSKGLFWPTDERVAIKRGINREEWLAWLLEHKQVQATIDDIITEAIGDGAFND